MNSILNIVQIVGLTFVLAMSSQRAAADMLPACENSSPFPAQVAVLRAVRIFTGPDGSSDMEELDVTDATSSAMAIKGVTHNSLGAASKVQLVSGPADVIYKDHTSPQKDLFLILRGGSTITLPNHKSFEATPGTLIIFDDMTSKTGHGGRSGPCGFVALNLVPADTTVKQ